jgi:protein involved in polysaccharide export with SLBB domain
MLKQGYTNMTVKQNTYNFHVTRLQMLMGLLCFLCLILAPLSSNAQNLRSYPFKPGDALMINTFPDTTSFLHRSFAIDDQGFVEFPITGKIKVSHMKEEDLKAFIKDKFKAYLKTPNVSIKPMVRVTMLGGFINPGLYYVDIHSSLWEVVRIAGGTVHEDGIYEIKWERGKEDIKDVTEYFESGISLRQMGFRSGDQFYTPVERERGFVQKVQDVMPFVTLGLAVTTLYISYQRDLILIQNISRR